MARRGLLKQRLAKMINVTELLCPALRSRSRMNGNLWRFRQAMTVNLMFMDLNPATIKLLRYRQRGMSPIVAISQNWSLRFEIAVVAAQPSLMIQLPKLMGEF